jgi:hypothetical protein
MDRISFRGSVLSFNAKEFCTRFLFDETKIWDWIWTKIFNHIVLGDVVPTLIFVFGGDGGGGGLKKCGILLECNMEPIKWSTILKEGLYSYLGTCGLAYLTS